MVLLKIGESVYFCTDQSDEKIGQFKAVNNAAGNFLESTVKFTNLLREYAEKYFDKGVDSLQTASVARVSVVSILDSARADHTPPIATRPDSGGLKSLMTDIFVKSATEKELDGVDKSIKTLNNKTEQTGKLLRVQEKVERALSVLNNPSVIVELKTATSPTSRLSPFQDLAKSKLLIEAQIPLPSFVKEFFRSIDPVLLREILEMNLVPLDNNYSDGVTLRSADIENCVKKFATEPETTHVEASMKKANGERLAVNIHAFPLLVYLHKTFAKYLQSAFDVATKGTPPGMFRNLAGDILRIREIISSPNLDSVSVASLEDWLRDFKGKYPDLTAFRFLSDRKVDKPKTAAAAAEKQNPKDFVNFMRELIEALIKHKQPVQVVAAVSGAGAIQPPLSTTAKTPPLLGPPPAKAQAAPIGHNVPLLGRDITVDNFITATDTLLSILELEERGNEGMMDELQRKRREILAKITNLRGSYVRLTNGDTSQNDTDFTILDSELCKRSADYFSRVSCEDLIDVAKNTSSFVERIYREFNQAFEWMLWKRIRDFGSLVKGNIDAETQSAVDSAWGGFSSQLPSKTLQELIKAKLLVPAVIACARSC
jgi:hypothetical protein